MFRKLKELLFGKSEPASVPGTGWYQLAYQDGALTGIAAAEDLDSAIAWCKAHLTDKDLIRVYHHTPDGKAKLRLTIRWE